MPTARSEPLLERDEDLAELEEIVGQSARGRGQLVVLEGPAGIGKTRLLEAVAAACEPAGHAVFSARGSELEREFAFGVVRQLFGPLTPAPGASPPADVFSGAAGLALPLLTGVTAADETVSHSPMADPIVPLLHGLYWLVANLAREQPVALVVDDAHWADLPSLRFLLFLATRLDGLAVLALAAVRSPEPGTPKLVQQLADEARVLRPSALSEGAVATLVRTHLGIEATDELCRACHDATGGNPFLTRELIRELAMAGVDPADAALELDAVRPRNVSRSVLLRIGRMPPEAARLARALAVLGDGADVRLSAELARLGPDDAAEAAAVLVGGGILADANPLRFLHPIVRTAVYADITEPERAREHERAAALLRRANAPPERSAVHLLLTASGGDAGVVATLLDAARIARSRGAPDTAAAFLRRALDEPPDEAQRLEVLRQLGTVEQQLGEQESALEHLREAHERSSSPTERALAALDLAVALRNTLRRTHEAIELFERAAPEVAAVDRELGLRLEAELASTAALDLEMAPRILPRVERVGRDLQGETPAERLLLAALSYLKHLQGGAAAPAAEMAHAAFARGLIGEQRSDALPVGQALFVLIVAEHDDAARFAAAAVADARRRGSPLGFAGATSTRARWFLHSQVREAEADARAAMEIRLGDMPLPNAMGHLVLSLLEQGEVGAASAVFDEFGMQSGPIFENILTNVLVFARARVRFEQGRNEDSLADLRDLERREDKWQVGVPHHPWRSTAALVLARLGRKADADEMVAEELRRARTWGVAGPIGLALRTLGLLEGGERGLDTLRESVEVLRTSASRLGLAKSLVDLGAALRRANRRVESRDPLREGLDLAERCGATALARRARDELAATGARPRKALLTGAASLTASERRICEMAASGMSNPEIAQALFVTIKNVEGHLTHAYRKLDIGSRQQLAAALKLPRGERGLHVADAPRPWRSSI